MASNRRQWNDGEKWCNSRHRGRRGCFWGDPGHGTPGSRVSRSSMDQSERSIERRVRRQSRAACDEGLLDYLYGEE